MSLTRLILIPALSSDRAPFMVVDPAGHVLQRGVLTVDAVDEPPVMRTVVVVPGVDVSIRWLDLPAGGAAQVRAAALWMLRDSLAATPDRVALTLGAPAPGQPRLVAVVSRALVAAWIDYLDALRVRPDVMVPDMLTPPEPADPAGVGELTALAFGSNVALRGVRFAATVQSDLVEVIAGGRPVTPIEDPREVERLMIATALNPPLNLLAGADRRDRAAAGGWRRAAILAAALVVSPLLLILATAARDDLASRRMTRETSAIIVQTWPDLAEAADPVAEVRRRAIAAAPPGGVTVAAAALFAVVEKVEGAELDSLTADPDGGVRATVSYPAYGDLDVLKSAMAGSGMTLTDNSTTDDNGRVVSDVQIGAAS